MPTSDGFGAFHNFDDLLAYLDEELGWPLQGYQFDDLTFSYEPQELGLRDEDAAKIKRIHQLRPLETGQPWGIFFVEFDRKKLPIVVLRRILSYLVVRKRASADKAEQQRVAVSTGLTPLRYEEFASWESLSAGIRRWHDEGFTPVGKINSGSQGVSISFFPLHQAASIEEELRSMREDALKAYGPAADKTALPVRLFEFAASTRYQLPDGGHLWDVRVECHVSPGHTTLIVDTLRICPVPFDMQKFSRDSVVSNLSGRKAGLQFVRTPFALHESGVTEIEWAGVSEKHLSAAMAALANWCQAALRG